MRIKKLKNERWEKKEEGCCKRERKGASEEEEMEWMRTREQKKILSSSKRTWWNEINVYERIATNGVEKVTHTQREREREWEREKQKSKNSIGMLALSSSECPRSDARDVDKVRRVCHTVSKWIGVGEQWRRCTAEFILVGLWCSSSASLFQR